jgi:F0F1-type ATP synthase assembly protein I
MTVAAAFAIPALVGVGLDRWLGSSPGVTISGAVIGFVLFMLYTLRLARELPGGSNHVVNRPSAEPRRRDDDELQKGR